MKKIILASSSPRRIEMMKNYGYDPMVMPADVDEALPMELTPAASVMYLALKKASHIEKKLRGGFPWETRCGPSILASDSSPENAVILAADTIVCYGGVIIGKPTDPEDAFHILSMLRGNSHQVLTGVCVLDGGRKIKECFCDISTVYFSAISDEALRAYVNTPEPYDKAGGYAIQGTFKKYIPRIEGDLDNIIGFPWYRIAPFLQEH